MISAPHRRKNLLTGEWVLVSPQRLERPWRGMVDSAKPKPLLKHDPECYLCPGNIRANNATNPRYTSTFVFENDFPALLSDPSTSGAGSEFFLASPVEGTCRVLCFSPRHDLRLSHMTAGDILHVVNAWAEQEEELGTKYSWVQIFENNGEMMGCSNRHPHGQIWATSSIPNEPLKEDDRQREYFLEHRSVLLADYLREETKTGERTVMENVDWIVFVPFWAVWPFETILLPKSRIKNIPDLNTNQRTNLADLLKKLLTKYDNLFAADFPYSMGWHGAPHRKGDNSHWWLHAHFYPPLLRSAAVRKFLVGYEMLSEPQRDMTPEQAAEQLRRVSG